MIFFWYNILMNKDQVKLRIEKLKVLIEKYRYSYHVLDKSLISDGALDSLKHELQELENKYPQFITPNSPTQRVGGKPSKGFNKVLHQTPMLSLIDVFATSEVADWEKRIEKVNGRKITGGFFAELKIDGLAVSLIYENGVLVCGVTRGDGKVGEDVTQNIKTIESIPLTINPKSEYRNSKQIQNSKLQIPKKIEIRGEVYMKKSVFDELNKKYKKEDKPLLANPRNAAAGSIRQLNSKLTASRKLSFIAYDVIMHKDI